MEVTVRGKHFDVPEHVQERARAKFSKLEHYLPLLEDAMCEVDLAHEKAKEPDQRYLIHVTVNGHGVHLQAQERAARPEVAVDQAAHVLSRQAQRHKDRLYSRGRNKVPSAPEPAKEKPRSDNVARVKRFAMKPMTVEEASEQMEALGHDFYVFHHAQADGLAVLYRRRAGDHGLIIPEFP